MPDADVAIEAAGVASTAGGGAVATGIAGLGIASNVAASAAVRAPIAIGVPPDRLRTT